MSFPDIMLIGCTGLLGVLLCWLVLVVIVAHLRPALVHVLVPAAVASALGLAGPAHATQDGSPDLVGLSIPDRPLIAQAHSGADPTAADHGAVQITVRSGDTLWAIVADHLGPASAAEIAAAVQRWHDVNRAVIGDNPDLIRPGQVLTSPQETP